MDLNFGITSVGT